jgi:hypothetical protein
MDESNALDVSWVTDAIDKLLDERGKIRRSRDAGWFHPSSLSDQCDARVAFDFLGYDRVGDIDARISRVLDTGNNRDRAWKGYLKKSGLSRVSSDVDRRIRIADWRIRGECDDIVEHPETGERWVAEIKTINQRGFDGLVHEPLPEHKIQLTTYLKGHGLARGFVVYENKNDSAVKVIPVRFEEDVWNGITAKIVRIITALRNEWFLDRNCKYGCAYKTLCPVYNPAEGRERLANVERILK